MANDGSVVILIEGDDRKFKSTLSGLGKIAGGAMKGITAAIGTVSAVLTAAGGYAVQVGSEFETSLAKVGTIADTSVKSLDELSAEVINISNATGEGAAALNEALYSAISAGADTAHATELVEVAVKAAKGGFTDTETAVDGLTSALNAYGMQTTEAEGLANKFLVTQNLGKTTFGELASSIGHVAPTANAAGVSIDDLLASVASLTANGIGTSEAMTGMKAAISNIIKPTGDAQKVAKQLGIDFSTAALKSKGWAGFLADIKEKTGGNTDQMAALFGSVEALNTVLTLTSDQGMALMNETLGGMATNTGALDDAYNAMTSTFEGATARLKTNIDNLAISVYEGLQEPLTGAAQAALDMVRTLQAAFDEGGLSGLVGGIGTVFADLALIIAEQAPAVIDAAVQCLQAFITGIQENLPQIVEAAISIVGSLVEGIISLLPSILELGISLLLELANGIISAIPQMVAQLPQIIDNFLNFISSNLPTILQKGVEVLANLANGIIQAIPQMVAQLPHIISSFVGFIASSLPQIVAAGVKLLVSLAGGIIQAIPQLVAQLPQIISAIVSGIGALLGGIVNCGTQIVQGLWQGISGAAGWLLGKIKGWAGSILNGLKSFLGIHSPSAVMRDQVGKMIALGVADGIDQAAGSAVESAGELADAVSDAAEVHAFVAVETDVGKIESLPDAAITEKLKNAVITESVRISGKLSATATEGKSDAQDRNRSFDPAQILAELRSMRAAVEKGQVLTVNGKVLGQLATQRQIMQTRSNGGAVIPV